MVRTPAEAEQFVREHWAHIRTWVRDLDSYGTDQFNIGVFLSEESANCCMDYMRRWQEDNTWQGIATACTAAAEFTEQRLKDVRQVEIEIALLRGLLFLLSAEPGDMTAPIWERVIVREQAALESLKKGMRP